MLDKDTDVEWKSCLKIFTRSLHNMNCKTQMMNEREVIAAKVYDR